LAEAGAAPALFGRGIRGPCVAWKRRTWLQSFLAEVRAEHFTETARLVHCRVEASAMPALLDRGGRGPSVGAQRRTWPEHCLIEAGAGRGGRSPIVAWTRRMQLQRSLEESGAVPALLGRWALLKRCRAKADGAQVMPDRGGRCSSVAGQRRMGSKYCWAEADWPECC